MWRCDDDLISRTNWPSQDPAVILKSLIETFCLTAEQWNIPNLSDTWNNCRWVVHGHHRAHHQMSYIGPNIKIINYVVISDLGSQVNYSPDKNVQNVNKTISCQIFSTVTLMIHVTQPHAVEIDTQCNLRNWLKWIDLEVERIVNKGKSWPTRSLPNCEIQLLLVFEVPFVTKTTFHGFLFYSFFLVWSEVHSVP